MRKTLGPLAATVLLLFTLAQAQAQGVPTLRLVPDAGAQGRGETLAAATGSLLLVHGNPATLAGFERPQVAAAYRRWIDNSGLYTLAASTPVTARGRLAVLVTAFDAAEALGLPDEGGFEVRAFNAAVAYAYGRGALRAGVAARYILERDATGERAQGIAVDAGVQAGVLEGGLRAGAAVQHLGTIGDLAGQPLTLPAVLRVGVAIEPLLVAADAVDLGPIARVLVAADVVRDLAGTVGTEPRTRLQVGAEVEGFDLIVGRAGYFFRDPLRGVTLGLGLRSGSFAFDFSYQFFRDGVGTGQGVALRYTL